MIIILPIVFLVAFGTLDLFHLFGDEAWRRPLASVELATAMGFIGVQIRRRKVSP